MQYKPFPRRYRLHVIMGVVKFSNVIMYFNPKIDIDMQSLVNLDIPTENFS